MKDLKKYYKKVIVCKNCNFEFGSDFKEEDCYCPICVQSLQHRRSKLIRKGQDVSK